MKYLLDTHAWLWLNAGRELSVHTQRLCRSAADEKRLFLAPISIWEAGLKASRKRLIVPLPIRVWLQDSVRDSHVILAAFDFDTAAECSELPPEFHGDPADRILAATCRVNGFTLLTRDKTLLRLAAEGVFRAQEV